MMPSTMPRPLTAADERRRSLRDRRRRRGKGRASAERPRRMLPLVNGRVSLVTGTGHLVTVAISHCGTCVSHFGWPRGAVPRALTNSDADGVLQFCSTERPILMDLDRARAI